MLVRMLNYPLCLCASVANVPSWSAGNFLSAHHRFVSAVDDTELSYPLDDFLRFQIDDKQSQLKFFSNCLYGFLPEIPHVDTLSNREIQLAFGRGQLKQASVEVVLSDSSSVTQGIGLTQKSMEFRLWPVLERRYTG